MSTQSLTSTPSLVSNSAGSPPRYSYKVKVINPNKKSDFMVLTWHNVHSRFDSPTALKRKLVECFHEYVPSELEDFNCGYMEGRGAAKRWIVSVQDIDTMYESFFEGQDIMLWCDMKKKDVPSRKRNSDEDTGVAKRKKIEDSDSRIKEELKQKHPDMQLTDPQFALWARLIRRGLHDSYETPPKIPLLAGNTKNKSTIKSSETEGGELGKALSGAATALVSALRAPVHTPEKSCPKPQGLSPNNRANMRRRCFEDLDKLHHLYENNVLNCAEFEEQKEAILRDLRNL